LENKWINPGVTYSHAAEAGDVSYKVQWNSTYPDAGYPDRQLFGSAWPYG